jgi:CheY-like chemotaxis protein
MDGLTAAQTIRAGSHPQKSVPIVAMTASALAEDRAACAKAGMNGYLTKPVRLVELANALDLAGTTRQETPVIPAQTHVAQAQDREAQLARRLREMFDGLDPDVVAPLKRNLIESFLVDVPHHIDQLSDQVTAGNYDTVAQLAHSLLGIAGNLGADRMATLSRRLEDGARAERLDDARDILRQLDEEYREVATSLVDA